MGKTPLARKIIASIIVLFFLNLPHAFASESAKQPDPFAVPCVEKWQAIANSEEKKIFNEEHSSGLVFRYYLDPESKNGLGMTIGLSYRDSHQERVFLRSWEINTSESKTALLLDNGKWHVLAGNEKVYCIFPANGIFAPKKRSLRSNETGLYLTELIFLILDGSGEIVPGKKKTVRFEETINR